MSVKHTRKCGRERTHKIGPSSSCATCTEMSSNADGNGMLRDDEGAWRKITLNVRTGKLQGNVRFGTTNDFWRLKAAVKNFHLKVIENSRSENWMWTACNTRDEWCITGSSWCVRNVIQGEIQLSSKPNSNAKLNNNPKVHYIIF
jgi:hypothetical protein